MPLILVDDKAKPNISYSMEQTKRNLICGTMGVLPANDEEFTMETRDASPAHLLVKIESFSMLSKHGIRKYESRQFEAGGYKWRLTIYPDGDENAKEGDHISAYLSMVGTSSLRVGWEVNAMFSVFLFNQISDNYLCFRGKVRRFHAMNPKWGFSKLISKKILTEPSNGYLVDDNCVFGAEVFVIKSQRVIDRVSMLNVTDPYKRKWKISPFFKWEEFTMETRDTSPAHLLVKIESFSMLSKHGIRKYESTQFEAGDYKWRLTIYPDGDENEKEGDHISAYLSMVGTSFLPVGWEVNAMFSVFLFNQISDNYLCFRGKVRRFHAMNPKWGFSKLISTKSLTEPSNGYLVDDNCVFGAEVFVIKCQRVIDCVSVLNVSDPYKRQWKISQFFKSEGVRTSEEFSTGDQRWKIKLFPNGNASEKGQYVSFYLECVDSKSFAPHEKVKADVCVRIKNKRYGSDYSRKFSHWYVSSTPDGGFSEFIRIADMRDPGKGYVIDDCCFLETEISVQAVVRDTHKNQINMAMVHGDKN